MNTDTPRTNACPHCGSKAAPFGDPKGEWECDSWNGPTGIFQSRLCKARAEVKEIRAALGDDGRRTHKEILEMAFKASEWRIWKQKYIDLRNAHMAEGQDPAGTIWEHADKLQKELKETKAEVARLKEELVDRDKEWFQVIKSFAGFHPVSITDALKQGMKRSKKAKNEVARLREENADLKQWLNERYKALSEADEEVARLRELLDETLLALERAIKKIPNNCTVVPYKDALLRTRRELKKISK
jgi:DNA repair exonuclease SbcCD ATPase subunit